MNLKRKSRLGLGVVLVVSIIALWQLRPETAIPISFRCPSGTCTYWSYQIVDDSVKEMTEPEIKVTSEQLSKGITIWAVGYDTITLSYIPTGLKVTKLTVNLSADAITNDGIYKGIAKYTNKQLWYNLTDRTTTQTDGFKYEHTATYRTSPESEITFRKKHDEPFSGSLKIKKKKKNTQVDVYLDDANKNNPIQK